MPASSSLDRPVFKSNSLAQFQELNSVHRLLTGSSVFPCTELGTFPRATCHSSCYPEDLDSGSSVPCPVHPKMRSKHLAGPPDKVICFPKDYNLHQIPHTPFALPLGSAILQVQGTRHKGFQTQPGVDQRWNLRSCHFNSVSRALSSTERTQKTSLTWPHGKGGFTGRYQYDVICGKATGRLVILYYGASNLCQA